MSHSFRVLVASLIVSAVMPIDLAMAQEMEFAGPAAPVTTSHEGIFNGKKVAYDAVVETITVDDANGEPGARVVGISYVAKATGQPNRPVLFVFNGGPISASIFLHLGAVGPKRIGIPDDLSADPADFELVDNIYSPLDIADIVMFDPAGTGLSQRYPGVDANAYRSVAADAQQFTAFVEGWLKTHNRIGSPIHVLGESYGTMRAAEAAGQLAEKGGAFVPSGVFLMGQAVNIIEYSQRPQNIISYAVSLPTLAAIAFEHGKAKTKGRSFDEFVWDAWDYGRTNYLEALFQGAELPAKTRARVAKALEEYSGIPASYYEANMLRITKEQFRVELLKDENMIVGRNDGRYKAEATDAGGRADPFGAVLPAFDRLFRQYLQNDLHVENAEAYMQGDYSAGIDGWDWGGKSPFSHFIYSDRIAKAFDANPDFQVVIGNGWHDTQTTSGAAEYLKLQSGWPQDRVRTSHYPGGHMAYTIEASAKTFNDDIRQMVRGE